MTVDAKTFWQNLEFRIDREIDGLRGDAFRGLWCDGLIPEAFEQSAGKTVVKGRAWMGRGRQHQELWRFELWLPSLIEDDDTSDWTPFLPPGDMTGWLALRQSDRFMRIKVGDAYHDLAE